MVELHFKRPLKRLRDIENLQLGALLMGVRLLDSRFLDR